MIEQVYLKILELFHFQIEFNTYKGREETKEIQLLKHVGRNRKSGFP